ncbi:MAG: hypothetical protein Fur0044_41860 [Anaerolineae bacterium]
MSPKLYPNLVELPGPYVTLYFSPNTEQRAREFANRCQRACQFLSPTLKFEAEICVLVLAPEHWQECTGSPMYGVPQTIDQRTLVVAGQNSELWTMITPPLADLSPAVAQAMQVAYGQPDGSIDLAAYMNLLAVHEMGHLYLDQAAGTFDFNLPRRWLVELFCQLCLHAYAAIEEPEQLPRLETFPKTIMAGGVAHLSYKTLDDFERLYADMEPPNFVWYLCQLHLAARRIFDAGGVETLQRLWQMLIQSREKLPDEQLALRLRTEVHPAVEHVLTRWPD